MDHIIQQRFFRSHHRITHKFHTSFILIQKYQATEHTVPFLISDQIVDQRPCFARTGHKQQMTAVFAVFINTGHILLEADPSYIHKDRIRYNKITKYQSGQLRTSMHRIKKDDPANRQCYFQPDYTYQFIKIASSEKVMIKIYKYVN